MPGGFDGRNGWAREWFSWNAKMDASTVDLCERLTTTRYNHDTTHT